jgi:hypothetical protein
MFQVKWRNLDVCASRFGPSFFDGLRSRVEVEVPQKN